MPLSNMQIDKFVVLWKNATGEDVSSEEARLIAARLIYLYRLLVHKIPNETTFTARYSDPVENADLLAPESS